MSATAPANIQLGAASFLASGQGLVTTGGWLGTPAATTLNVNGALTNPLLAPAFDDTIYPINVEVAPLLTLLGKAPLPTIQSHGNLYYWTVDRPMPEHCLATGSDAIPQGDNANVNIDVSYVDMWSTNDTVWVPDAGDAYGVVVAQPTATGGVGTIAVQWLTGHAPTAAIGIGTAIYKLGNTNPEIGVPVPHPFTLKIDEYNVFQEQWFARQVSDRLKREKWQIGTPLGGILPYETEKLRREAMKEREKTFWFGQRSWYAAAVTNIGAGVGTMGGVYYAPGARRWNYGGNALVQADWESFIARGTRHRLGMPGTLDVHCSSMIRGQVSAWAQASNQVHIRPGETTLGNCIAEYQTREGPVVRLITNKLFDFLGRDDLAVMIWMEAGAVARIASNTYPELTYQEFLIPYGASWSEYGFKVRESLKVADGFGHVDILHNVGPSSATLI